MGKQPPAAPTCRCTHDVGDHERGFDGVWAFRGQCQHCHCLDYSPDLTELRRETIAAVSHEVDSRYTLDEVHEWALTDRVPPRSKLHCLDCGRVLSDYEWGEAQPFGGHCRECRGNHCEFIAVGSRDPGD